MIDCMVLNTVFNTISLISWQQEHLSMPFWSSLNQYLAQYSFEANDCFATKSLSKQKTAMREKKNPVATTITNPLTEYWLIRGLNQWLPVSKSNDLTHYQTTNFGLFQSKKVCRRQFQI